jgi:phosphopantothenoylcysteine decarboxylase/phosphopantothenate--cysteine ligase
MSLANKNIVLGVTGGIAAYKAVALVRRLQDAQATVRVVMTEAAKAFVTPLTFQAISGFAVYDDLLDPAAELAMGHIELARWADMIVIAPATADSLARLSQGRANDLLSACCLASSAIKVCVPAMNQQMWHQDATQKHCAELRAQGWRLLGPEAGHQACGDQGLGRMLAEEAIVTALADCFANGALDGIPVLITAGPTQEPIDPVRYISNHSSGKMGYALANAAQEAGAKVTLVSGPVALAVPAQVSCISVETACQMQAAVMAHMNSRGIFMGVAAVADYRCASVANQKIKKGAQESYTLGLVKNPDILCAVRQAYPKAYVVGFAAETERLIVHAKAKMKAKGMDRVVANQVGKGVGFATEEHRCTVITAEGELIVYPQMRKVCLARQLMVGIAEAYCARVLEKSD